MEFIESSFIKIIMVPYIPSSDFDLRVIDCPNMRLQTLDSKSSPGQPGRGFDYRLRHQISFYPPHPSSRHLGWDSPLSDIRCLFKAFTLIDTSPINYYAIIVQAKRETLSTKCPKCHSENTDTARFCSNCALLFMGTRSPSHDIISPVIKNYRK